MRKQSSLEKSIVLGMGEGGRRGGRQCMRWKDDIKTVTGLTLSELVRAVENRDDWRQLITTVQTLSSNASDSLVGSAVASDFECAGFESCKREF
ncbi:endonuclease-reverse transcriptase [Elysia marginata]|uniref:Endonuclease-reverse transcriptase n=1 Tax=Elysia marginata TaxID=1093978 RepID=A0AAV4FS81_9GAST|nr:endonuclease-reverse transcriptase [Elysia marginata]